MGKPKYAWKPLIRKNDVAGLRAWLDAGGDIDEYDPVMSARPILWAALHGQLDCVQLLAERGAKLDRALNVATTMKHKAVIRYLLTRKPGRREVANALDIQVTEHCDEPDRALETDLRKAKRKTARPVQRRAAGRRRKT